MAEFADRMKSFTDHLRDSIESRAEALSQVHDATEELLDGARTFLGQVADEHRARAEELQASLASHRTDCCRKVAEMRHNHQESLSKMRHDLHHMLSETRQTRQDAVQTMTETFQKARHELADDLRKASNAWQEFAAHASVHRTTADHGTDEAESHPTASRRAGRRSRRNPTHGKHANARSN